MRPIGWFRGARWGEILLVTALVVALVHGYLQNQRVRSLRHEYGAVERQMGTLATRRAEVERDLRHYRAIADASVLQDPAALTGVDLNGEPVLHELTRLRTSHVFYSLDPECPACMANLDFIGNLAASAPCGARVVGVVVRDEEQIMAMAKARQIRFPVVRQGRGRAWDLLPLAVSPATSVVAPGGKVVGWWVGLLTPGQQREVVAALTSVCQRGAALSVRGADGR